MMCADDLDGRRVRACTTVCTGVVTDANGLGNVAAATTIRSRFQSLMLEWQRAGAAAATVTGIADIATMQLDAMQYIQEVFYTRT